MTTQFDSLDAIHAAALEAPGALLFTISAIADQGTSMARIYTTHPEVYPVGGIKTFADDTNQVWIEQVIRGQQPFFGPDVQAVRDFFFDSATIEELGCGAIINVPVIANGEVIGSMNFLDADGAYAETDVATAVDIASRSVDAVTAAYKRLL